LCHLVDFISVLFVPVYTITEGYALSTNGCDRSSYTDIAPADFERMQAAELISADLPLEASVSWQQALLGQTWLILGALALMVKGLGSIGGARKRKTTTPDMLAIHSLVAMSQVAVADGKIDDSEVKQIAQILTRLTGNSYGRGQVADLLHRLNPSPSDLAQIGTDLSENDRQITLEAALNIAVADGEISLSEYPVVSDLAQRMRIGADAFRSAMARISAHLQSTPTS
jgi:tellurite resistance protein